MRNKKMSLMQKFVGCFTLLGLLFFVSCQTNFQSTAQTREPQIVTSEKPPLASVSGEIKKLLESAIEQTTATKTYDPAYVVIPYPMGDVPPETGVCTDVVIRAFRKAGVDLQQAVHEDMKGDFSVYPQKWNLKKPDTNIDHRRVPNLQTYFTRRGKSLAITDKAESYEPGDVVAWDLDGKGLTHVGLVSNLYNDSTKRYLIIHNIGGGARAEDRLFDWKIIGHYRYF
jgi:uncharacterized protein YijF (DUF1287 family)